MSWGGGYYTALSRRRQRFSRNVAVTSSGMTQEEVERCELEIWSNMASAFKSQEGKSQGGERVLH
jgi:hypothetical protein